MKEKKLAIAVQAGLVGVLTGAIISMASSWVLAQTVGDVAEMERLQSRAEEAIANGDAESASMNIGKAALMASQLAKREGESAKAHLYLGAEALFRAQEHAYRALALYQRAGGTPPASSGVCTSLRLAGQTVRQASERLAPAVSASPEPQGSQQAGRLQAGAAEWIRTIDAMRSDFQCE